jgi:DNA-binding winged helix-turn-helix (wHTH) protein
MKSFGPFRLDTANQSLWRGDTRVPLMPKPFAVLQHLVDRAGQLVTQDQLLEAIWPDTFVQPEVLRRYILEVRRALDDQAGSPRFVQTFPKRGYQFIAEVIDHSADKHIGHSDDGRAEAGKLVGRARALADLRGYFAQALAGRRHVIFVVGESGIGKTSVADAFQRISVTVDGVSVAVARGQSVEGFGGKEPYYPLLEAIGQLARGPLRTLVVDTLATYAPTWLIQFPSLMRPEQQAALQREILGATRERMVRSARSDHADRAAGADPRRSALGRSLDAGRHFSDRAAARARTPARARHVAAGGIDPLRQPAQGIEAGSAAAPIEP